MMIRDFGVHLIISSILVFYLISTEEIMHEIKHILTKSTLTAMDSYF